VAGETLATTVSYDRAEAGGESAEIEGRPLLMSVERLDGTLHPVEPGASR
jgi:hypothetical protein